MTPLSEEDFVKAVLKEKIIAIVRGVNSDKMIKTIHALSQGCIHLIEITCDTPGVEGIIRRCKAELKDDFLLGAGTVTSTQLAKLVIDAGAKYIITPNLDEKVVRYCQERNIPVIPGVTTPTEILQALKYGIRMVKLFPAGALGTAYIKQIRSPIKDVRIVAVGGIDLDNAREMFQAGADALGIGSSMVNAFMVENEKWDEIESRARQFVKIAGES